MAITVGSVEVDVVPNTQGIANRLRAGLVPAGNRVGEELGRIVGQHVAAGIAAAVRDGITQGGRTARPAASRQGDDSGGAFGRAFRARVEAAVRNLPRADVRLGDTGFNADMARLRARLESLAGRRIGVDVDAASALAEIDRLEAELTRLGGEHPDVQVRMDTAAAVAQLAALRAEIDAVDGRDVDVNVRPSVRSFGLLTTAVGAFGAAAVPAVAGVAAVVGGLAAAFASAGVAAGVLGLAVKPQLKTITDAATAAQKAELAQAKATNAKAYAQSLAAKGGDAYTKALASSATAAKNAELAQLAYKSQLDGMPPATRQASEAFIGLKKGFSGWSDALASTTMPLFTRGFQALTAALPALTPLAKSAAGAVGNLVTQFSGFVTGGGLRRSVGWLARTAGPQLGTFVRIAVNFGLGFAGVLRAFAPAADSVSGALKRLSSRFREWGQSGAGVRALLGYVRQTGPGVGEALGNIGGAALNLLSALAPLGGTGVAFLNALAAGVRAVPVPVLTVLGVAFSAVAIGSKLAAAGLGLWRAGAVAAGLATQVLTGQTLALNAAQRANLIGLIVTAIIALVVAVIYAWNHWEGFRNVVLAAWRGIQAATSFAWNQVLKPTFAAIVTAVRAVGTAAVWLWEHAVGPVFRGIWTAAKLLLAIVVFAVIAPVIVAFKVWGAVAMWLWRSQIQPAFRAVGALAVWLYQRVIRPQFQAAQVILRAVGTVVGWLWRNAVTPAFRAIAALTRWLYGNVVRPNLQAMQALLRALGSVFRWLYTSVIRPVWNGVAAVISGVWSRSIRPVLGALRSAVGLVADAFRIAKDAIRMQWDGLRDATRKPVNWVINTVWNRGVVSLWGKIGGWIPGLPKLGKLPLLAQGGTVPAAPGVFNRPTAIVGEGNPSHPEFVIPTDPRYRGRALSLWEQAGGRLMADGGVLGTLKGIGGSIVGGLGSAASFLTDPGKVLASVFKPFTAALAPITHTGWGKLVAALPAALLKGLTGLVTGASGGSSGDVGAHGASATAAQNIARVLLARYGWAQNQMPSLVKLWNGESGWRWNALNKSSGAYGIPQSLPASKMASAGADWRTNAATQIRWGLGYIKSRYGSPSAAWSTWLARSPHWYDSGGMLAPGLNLAYNGTGRPEPVLTGRQWDAIVTVADRSTAAKGDTTIIYNGAPTQSPQQVAMETARRLRFG